MRHLKKKCTKWKFKPSVFHGHRQSTQMPPLKLVQKTENLRRLFFAVEGSFTFMYAVVPWSTKMLCLKLQNKAFFFAVPKRILESKHTQQAI